MRFRICALLTAVLAAAGLLTLPAAAQQAPGACAAGDLPCRIAALERRVAALEAGFAAATTAATPSPSAMIDVSRPCGASCNDDAIAVCVGNGFVHGTPEEWRRDRSALMLTRAACSNEAPRQ